MLLTMTQTHPIRGRESKKQIYYQLCYAIARVFIGGGRSDGEEEKEDCRRQRRGEHFLLRTEVRRDGKD